MYTMREQPKTALEHLETHTAQGQSQFPSPSHHYHPLFQQSFDEPAIDRLNQRSRK